MTLIEFKDLPDISTPANAANLNNNFKYLDEKTEVYSTSEVKTNKVWINNKPIYRKVINGTTPSTPYVWGDIGTINNIECITSMIGTLNGYLAVPTFVSSDYHVALQWGNTNNIQALVDGTGYLSKPITVIVEYTKSN